MSSLGYLLLGRDKRTLVLPLPVAPMTLWSGLADGRKATRGEDAWDVSNRGNQSERNETLTQSRLQEYPLPAEGR
jgi:hypothetical protein